jgi:hypothetical protein
MDDKGRGFDSRHLHLSGLIRTLPEVNLLGGHRVGPRLCAQGSGSDLPERAGHPSLLRSANGRATEAVRSVQR